MEGEHKFWLLPTLGGILTHFLKQHSVLLMSKVGIKSFAAIKFKSEFRGSYQGNLAKEISQDGSAHCVYKCVKALDKKTGRDVTIQTVMT